MVFNKGSTGYALTASTVGGAKAGFTSSALTLATLGYTIKADPVENEAAVKAINVIEANFSLAGNESGDFKPVYRSSGVCSWFTNRGVATGRNIVIPENENGIRSNYKFIY